MYVVYLHHGHRYWIDRQGWATAFSDRATRYTESEARTLAHQMHGEAVPA